MRNTSGITLIALVIIIIVLLILAGVSIATLTGQNGLLTKAKNSKEQTEIINTIEQARIDIEGIQVGKEGNITESEVNNIIANYDKEKKIRDDKEERYIITEGGYEIKVSDIWNGTVLPSKLLAKDVLNIDTTATEAKDKSPYVKYNNLDCRVLYNDDTHGIQIVTSESLEEIKLGAGDTMVTASDFVYDGTATLKDGFKIAAASYNNAVDNLNNKAKTHMDSKGIATDARCLGSVSTLTSEFKFQNDSSEMWSSTAYAYLTNYKWNNRFKTGVADNPEDVTRLNTLGLNVSSGYIWLASRRLTSDATYTQLYIRNIDPNGKVDSNDYNICDVTVWRNC